jgi:hypothetical protein
MEAILKINRLNKGICEILFVIVGFVDLPIAKAT